MFRSIDTGFAQLMVNLEITDLQKDTVAAREQNIKKVMVNGLTVLDSFTTGSYARGTMIAPLKKADIDIFIILDPSYYSTYNPASLLDKTREVLLKTYTQTPKISRNGQAVTISFTDFIVDVVPAFYRTGEGYLIPSSTDRAWIETNPKYHVGYVNTHNLNHNGNLIPLIRMIKGWNKNIGDAFISFYLELMAIEILDGIRIDDFPSAVRYFFDHGREKIKYVIQDPVSYGGKIKGLSGVSNVIEAVSRFNTAYSRALKAEQFARAGQIENAYNEWRMIFGDYFPSY